jgi:hypothetical protein
MYKSQTNEHDNLHRAMLSKLRMMQIHHAVKARMKTEIRACSLLVKVEELKLRIAGMTEELDRTSQSLDFYKDTEGISRSLYLATKDLHGAELRNALEEAESERHKATRLKQESREMIREARAKARINRKGQGEHAS